MKTELYRAADRGYADHGWLKARHYFSFAGWYDPKRVHFGALRVVNDDHVAAGRGFGTHPHDNMEIITIPTLGQLEHKDSMGNGSVIKPGEVQVMSAGTGVQHSEFNPSHTDPTELFQIWIYPDSRDVEPRYDQAAFDEKDLDNKIHYMVGPVGNDARLKINQDAWISLSDLSEGNRITYRMKDKEHGVFTILVEGNIVISGTSLSKRDALGISDVDEYSLEARDNSRILFIEVPMKF